MRQVSNIETGDKFISRRGANIAVVLYVSANGDIGYRLKWTRRTHHSTEKNFRRNYTPLVDNDNDSDGMLGDPR